MVGILGWILGGAASVGVALLVAVLWIPRELWKRWRGRITDRIDQVLRRKVSRFDRRYQEFVLGELRYVDLKGLATVGFYTPELDEVFVDVSLAYRAPHQVSESVLAQLPAGVTDRHSIGEFLDRPQPVVLAVTGAPGSGKTTLLRHTARVVCRDRRGRRAVPILLYLRDHVAAIVSTPKITLDKLVRGTLGRYATDEPPGWFQQRLHDGDCVVLLDGLDEVARQEDRRQVADWVEHLTRQYPKNDYVITSRPHGYRTAGIDGAVVLQVRSFTDDQVARFVRGWYLSLESHATGETGEDVLARAESAAEDLLDKLNANLDLYELTVNPLLLTMIANVHRYRGALPGSRADLYGEICQVMLWRRHEAKKLRVELSGDRKETVLRGLAFTMMRQRSRDISRTDVLSAIRPVLRRMSTTLTEADFLADISSNGLLVERESSVYSFAHPTFQEYLAAVHIHDKGLAEILAESIDDVWWRETTLLYAARSDADPIVKACLSAGTVTALSLAFDCAEQGRELAPELSTRLDELLNSTHDDPERRRLQASVILTRHLRHLIRTSHGGRVCPRPISTRVYGLYCAATGGHPLGGANLDDPIMGVRGSEALDVVRWVNDLTGGEPGYRLPHRTEIDDPAVQRALAKTPTLSPWLEPAVPGHPELWTPAGSDHPHAIDFATLAGQVHEDVTRSTPTLVRLLLLKSLTLIRALDRAHALTRTRIRAHALAHALAHAHDLDHALTLTRDLDRDHLLDRALGLDRAIAGALTRDLAGARDRLLDRALGLDRAVPYSGDIMGRALSGALDLVLKRTTIAADWLGEFSRAFIDKTHGAEKNYVVSLDGLVNKVHSVQENLAVVGSVATSWAHRVAVRLGETALPVVTRQEPLTAEAATAIRLAALCLAAEARAHGPSLAGDNYREIAAGITLLERRANGQAPVTETIILATS